MRVVVKAATARRMPSLEREPKTLSLNELNYARVRKPSLALISLLMVLWRSIIRSMYIYSLCFKI
jgi:hypothetical protein